MNKNQNKNDNQNQRIKSIDIAKSFAMLCIIAGHLGVPELKPFVFSFHVPIFYLVSGYLLNKRRSLREYGKVKCRQLLIPYVFTCLAIIIGTTLTEVMHSKSLDGVWPNIKMWLAASLYGSGTIERAEPFYIRQIGAIWFLPALFVGLMIVRFFIQYERGYIGVLVCAYVGYKTTDMIWFPLSIQAGMVAAFFIWLGYRAGVEKLLEIRPHPAILAGLAGIWILCIRYSGRVYLVRNYFENGLLDVLGAVAGSYLVVLIADEAGKRIRFTASMTFIGQNSLLILCCHAFDMVVFSWDPVRHYFEGRGFSEAGIIWGVLALRILFYIVIVMIWRCFGVFLRVCKRREY